MEVRAEQCIQVAAGLVEQALRLGEIDGPLVRAAAKYLKAAKGARAAG
ncbi:hypothetical protein [Methylocaldum sp.]|nr:hypothetical protein [Methylocaldum sp.]HYE38203.1 hypothetical protein [Methylocaldum sp.]